MGFFNFSVPEEEKTLLVMKACWLSYAYVWLKILAVGLALGFILTFGRPFWWGTRWGKIGIIIFLLSAIAYAAFDFWKRFLNAYIITQCRLIDITQEKFFRRVITEININEIEEVLVKQGSWLDVLFKKGDIIIKLQDEKGILVFYDIKNPETVQKFLNNIKKETAKIIDKKGEECNIILKDNQTHKIPLSYSYYGEKLKNMAMGKDEDKREETQEKLHKESLIIVKKKRTNKFL